MGYGAKLKKTVWALKSKVFNESLLTAWYSALWGTQGWLGVWERVVWAVGYIQQLKALLASSSGISWWMSTV
jgi:hypothetical protein